VKRTLALPIIALALVMAAVATQLTVGGVGVAAAGQGSVPDPGVVNSITYVFSSGQITSVNVEVEWDSGIGSGDYVIRVELLDSDGTVLAEGETTVSDPTPGSTDTYSIDISPDLDFDGIQAYVKVNVYIVQV